MKKISFLVKNAVSRVKNCGQRAILSLCAMLIGSRAFAAVGDVGAGVGALDDANAELLKYLPVVQNIVYTICGIIALTSIGVLSYKIQNEDQDSRKSIMALLFGVIVVAVLTYTVPKILGLEY